jgi:hypothetical protein
MSDELPNVPETVTPEAQTTEQVSEPQRNENGQLLPGVVLNPEGKGGFQDHPELINPGGRPKNQESFTYWMNFFKNLATDEFLGWLKNNPTSSRTVAADIAYTRVFNARKELDEFKEVADRTEGKAPQTVRHEGGFFSETQLKISTVDEDTAIDEGITTQPETEANAPTA